jgi:ABC-2 type transport system permease protein
MNAATETGDAIAVPATPPHPARPFYWSVRRELWENRALTIAPAVAVGVIVLGVIVALIGAAEHVPHAVRALGEMPADRQHGLVSGLYFGIAMIVMAVSLFTVSFYVLDALISGRRDRSILFWKSMPVSDTTAVVSKLFTAMFVAPLIAFVCTVAAQLVLLVVGTVTTLIGGGNALTIWSNLQLVQIVIATFYLLLTGSLWFAPVTAWLLLVSAWAKRGAILWALLPPLAVMAFEKIGLGTNYVARLLEYRLQDGFKTALVSGRMETGLVVQKVEVSAHFPDNVLQILDPVGFLSNPWMWVGLVVAAAFTAAAIWLRRYREPL